MSDLSIEKLLAGLEEEIESLWNKKREMEDELSAVMLQSGSVAQHRETQLKNSIQQVQTHILRDEQQVTLLQAHLRLLASLATGQNRRY